MSGDGWTERLRPGGYKRRILERVYFVHPGKAPDLFPSRDPEALDPTPEGRLSGG